MEIARDSQSKWSPLKRRTCHWLFCLCLTFVGFGSKATGSSWGCCWRRIHHRREGQIPFNRIPLLWCKLTFFNATVYHFLETMLAALNTTFNFVLFLGRMRKKKKKKRKALQSTPLGSLQELISKARGRPVTSGRTSSSHFCLDWQKWTSGWDNRWREGESNKGRAT